MINLSFFPSRRMALYMVRLFLTRSFAVLFALILWMYHVLAHKPGGQPIGALEWFFAAAAKRVRSLMPKPRDARAQAAVEA